MMESSRTRACGTLLGTLLAVVVVATACSSGAGQQLAPHAGERPGHAPAAQLYQQADVAAPLEVRFLEEPGVLADDFVVPDGEAWKLEGVELVGQLLGGGFEVRIYADAGGAPGHLLHDARNTWFATVVVQEEDNRYWIGFPGAPTLVAGRYWLGLYYPAGEHFYWREFPRTFGGAVHFTTGSGPWSDLGELTGGACCDLTFGLYGTSRQVPDRASLRN